MRITWDEIEKRLYETGVSKGVLYVADPNAAGGYGAGVPWNGLTAVNEGKDGGDVTTLYADNIEYLHIDTPEKFTPTIECYTYPDEFGPCIGEVTKDNMTVTAQTRKLFGFTYRTEVGSEANNDLGYKIHIVYGCKASPSEVDRSTINDSPEAITFSFDCTTSPVDASALGADVRPTAHVVVDSRGSGNITELENLLYGPTTGEGTPKLPTIAEIKTALAKT